MTQPSRADALPTVSIVGRPNVGKSTLFNRLSGTRRAIVDSKPGITRDRLEAPVEWRGHWFRIVDTGGMDLADAELIPRLICDQARAALAQGDAIVLVVDARAGLTPVDEEIAEILRQSAVPVLLAANKVDGPERVGEAAEFHVLGLEPVTPLSAEQGYGVDDLLDRILEALPDTPTELVEDEAIRIAVVGRPNVGKSSLVNRLLGEERVIVSDIPGTTRDAIDVRLKVGEREFVLVDTAGLRRQGKDRERVEHVARSQAHRALERADVALLLIDAGEGPTHQDAVIGGAAVEAGAGLVVVANKWDLVTEQELRFPRLVEEVRTALKFAPWAPVVTISVKTGERVARIFPEAERVHDRRRQRIGTAELNELVQAAMRDHQPPQAGKKREFRVKYLTQVASEPPTFVAFTTGGAPHFSWQRYLENRLRETFDLEGTPIVVRYRSGKGGGGPRGRRRS